MGSNQHDQAGFSFSRLVADLPGLPREQESNRTCRIRGADARFHGPRAGMKTLSARCDTYRQPRSSLTACLVCLQVCGVRSQQPFSSQAAANTIAQEWQLQRNTQEAQGGQGPSGGGPQSEHHTTCSFDPPAVLPSPRAPSPFLPSLLVPLPAALQSAPPSPITATHIPPSTLAATHIPPAPLLAAPASPLTTPAAVPHSPSAFIPADVHSPPASPIATPHSPLPSSPAVNCSPAQQAALLAQPVPQLPEPPPMVPGPGREMGAEARGVGESLVPGETSADTARAMDEEGTPQPALSGSVTGEAGHVQVLPHTPAPALCSQVVPPATSCQLGCTGPGLSQPKPSPTPIIADRLREGDQHMAPAPQGPPHATSPPTVPPLSEPSVTGPSLAAPNPGAQHERGPSTLLSIRPGKRLEATAAPPLLTSTQQQLSAALTSGSLGWERATLQGAEQGISMVTQHRKPMGEGGEQAGAKGGQTATAQAVASMVRVGCKGRGHSRLGRPKAPSLSQVHHPKIVRLRMRLGALKTTRQALGL